MRKWLIKFKKIEKTESILEENTQNLNQKSLYLKEREEIIEAMSRKIQSLHSTLDAIKVRLLQILAIFLVCYMHFLVKCIDSSS